MKQWCNMECTKMSATIRCMLLMGVAAAALLVGVSGCRTFSLKPPSGFVRYERTSNFYRAVSPDNAVIVVSSRKNKPKGDLGFWVETVKRDFTAVRGYKFIKDAPAKAGSGNEGKSLWFEASHQGRMYTYRISIFVAKNRIFSVETATETESLERHEKAFDAAVSSLKIL